MGGLSGTEEASLLVLVTRLFRLARASQGEEHTGSLIRLGVFGKVPQSL